MINWVSWRVFLTTWATKLWDRLYAVGTFLTVPITLVGFYGLTATNFAYANLALLILPGYITFLAFQTIPRFHLTPSALVGQQLEMAELSRLAVKIFVVGLVGASDAGKTTFLSAVLHRNGPKRRTAVPYACIVALPNRNPTEYVAIVDSVGQLFDNQFDVVRQSDLVILFLDHNASETAQKSNSTRLNAERTLVDQVARTHEYETGGARSILIVGNKCDLWDNDPATFSAMKKLLNQCEERLSSGAGFRNVRRIDQFSNRSAESIWLAMQEIENAANNKL